MPRPETPIDPAGPLAEFASGLRALRHDSGLGYREMAGRVGYSTAVLSQAASGRNLPTWEVTRAFVTACGGREETWRARWETAAQAWRLRPEASLSPGRKHPKAAPDPADGIEHGPAEPGAEPSSGSEPSPPPQNLPTKARDDKDKFVRRLQHLRALVGTPTRHQLSRMTPDVSPSTMANLLNGNFLRPPRWELVNGFVSACLQVGRQRRLRVPPELASLEVWRREHSKLSAYLEGTARPIKVLVAEDMHLLRAGLASFLREGVNIELVAALRCDHQQVAAAAARYRPDIAIVSVDKPGTRGLATVRELHKKTPESRVVALTVNQPGRHLKGLHDAKVSGLVNKDAPADRLLEAIRKVADGGTMIDPDLVPALSASNSPFTRRELSVLQLMARGASRREIAHQLAIRMGTEQKIADSILAKTDAETRAGAVHVALDAGWIQR